MKSLRDQLMKAGLTDKKKVRQIDHQKRVERKSDDLSKNEDQEKQKQLLWEQKQEEERKRQRELAGAKSAAEEKRQVMYRARDIVLTGQLRSGTNGNRRFYFVTRDGKLSFLEVSDKIGRQLEKGDLAIVETPGEQRDLFALVPRKAAQNLTSALPDYVLFFNGDQGTPADNSSAREKSPLNDHEDR